ncbi:Hypothetical protein; putative signal peptide [Leptospira biflexa serovar Patoc strain 'Patoc 1 (Paris)']|uniref:Uncharacterized protein n=1 Tax=Leptospira biflexa serovar Patoc (strain Patoc 1 / ATCC 23582 / Paris) TaxID=456481 RepID=B0SIX3_LEPBP|nr:Hypothetical protein; putative signal peptide [Leptospira biflexa serovar Patoc strain 'Patoc 1 (Paris)']
MEDSQMNQNLTKIIFLIALVLLTGVTYAGPEAKMKSETYLPNDPNKKKAGEECKSSDECQKHHECKSDGEKNVCTEPPRSKLPPGVVT